MAYLPQHIYLLGSQLSTAASGAPETIQGKGGHKSECTHAVRNMQCLLKLEPDMNAMDDHNRTTFHYA